MKINPVLFIASHVADHHGIGYMRALLSREGFNTSVIDLRKGKRAILRNIQQSEPRLIGFSFIFQSNFRQFTELISYLRGEGVICHFTAGGHYASLKYEELFTKVPMLDSIVRFEGEYTILELAKCIYSGSDWKKTDGLVYMNAGKLVVNTPRKAEKDLDKFPVFIRPRLKKMTSNIKFATILAGRGCSHNCSFCNTSEYYRQMAGPTKRNRRPEMVVDEMFDLYNNRQCSVFMFDDDDFPVTSGDNNSWILQFCDSLRNKRLIRKVIWKINCRPDEIDEKNFRLMKEHGLFHVFIGIEDGTEEGLRKLNKKTSVEQNIKNINILKELGIGFDFGFMLFQPETTFDSLNKNLIFLQNICGDGYTPLTFLKLLPLYETRVEKELLKEGRLKAGNYGNDYSFLEKSLDDYYSFVMSCLHDCLTGNNGFVNVAQCAINNLEVHSHFFETTSASKKFNKTIHAIISDFNMFIICTLQDLAGVFKSGQYRSETGMLQFYRMIIKTNHEYYRNLVLTKMIEFSVVSSD